MTSLTALGITVVLTGILLFTTACLDKFINRRIAEIISRVMAILLAALSVQYILEGLSQTGLLQLP